MCSRSDAPAAGRLFLPGRLLAYQFFIEHFAGTRDVDATLCDKSEPYWKTSQRALWGLWHKMQVCPDCDRISREIRAEEKRTRECGNYRAV